MITVKIIGVPEHFNLPWHMAIEEGAFKERGINLEWEDIPEGTGRMCQLLANKETDLAIILTEGLVKSITEGAAAKIVQEYISTPLHWGIHVAEKSNYSTIADLESKTIAISRYGSGSHLMAYVHAQKQGWDLSLLKFKVIHNLDGAVAGLTNGEADYFMWEHYTTKPLVDKGVFRRLADCPTPWPCFVIAATDDFIAKNKGVLNHVLEVINNYSAEFKNIPSIDHTLANAYNQQLEDIQSWLGKTNWSQKQLPKNVLKKVQNQLVELDIITTKLGPTKILRE